MNTPQFLYLLLLVFMACGLVYGWSDARGDVPVPSVGK